MNCIFTTNKRQDYHPGLDTQRKREEVLKCLKWTRCPMGTSQIRIWIIDQGGPYLKNTEIWYQLIRLRKEGLLGNTGKLFFYMSAHPPTKEP